MASDDRLHQFGPYRKACEQFDLAAADLTPLVHNPVCIRLVSQQMASADSIASNIEERYGRGSRKDYAHFWLLPEVRLQKIGDGTSND